MRKIGWVTLCVVVGCAAAANAAFVETNAMPFWTGTDGSTAGYSTTDANGNAWAVYNANGANGGEGNPHFDEWDEWTPLAFGASENMWGGRGGGFTSGLTFQADGYYSAPGMIITVDAAGTYSWYGEVYAAEYNSPTVVFGKISGGNWSALYRNDRTIPLYTSLDLSTISELQDISLDAGDQLTIYVGKIGGGWTDVSFDGTGIGFVPEPATMALVVMGGAGLLRRRVS
jgi:hypothetical protein